LVAIALEVNHSLHPPVFLLSSRGERVRLVLIVRIHQRGRILRGEFECHKSPRRVPHGGKPAQRERGRKGLEREGGREGGKERPP